MYSCVLEIPALLRPRERSLKSLLTYNSAVVGQFKGASRRQQKAPFLLQCGAMDAHEYHCVRTIPTSDEELLVTEVQQK